MVRITLRAANAFVQEGAGKPILDTHAGQAIGWITECSVGDEVLKFEAVTYALLEWNGISYEIAGAIVSDVRAKVWDVVGFREFTGLATVETPAYAEAYIT